MGAPAVPDWLETLLDARPGARRAAARVVLDAARPWEEMRRGLAAAVTLDPARATPGLSALRAEAERTSDRGLAGRIGAYEGHGIHRAGRVDEAVEAYVRAERDLRATGLDAEALATAIVRVDALATAGHGDAALRLAATLARSMRGRAPDKQTAALSAHRGNALRLRGDADGARAAYDAAARTFDALGDRSRAAATRLNAAVSAVEAGDATDGRARLAAAAEALAALGNADLAREARANVAWADVHAGRLGEGIRALDRLAEEHRDAGLVRREAICRMDLADALRRAGDGPAAEREAVRAAARFDAAGAPAERAEALWLAALAAGATSLERAQAHALAARRAALASGRPSIVVRADLVLLDAAMRGRRPPTPVAIRHLVDRARTLGHRALLADARILEGTAALAGGRGADARRAFKAARRLSSGRPWTRWAAETGLAEVGARRPGQFGAALARLRRIAAFVESVRTDLPGPWLRARFAADRLDPWLVRVDLLLERGRPEDRREAEGILDALAARRFLATRAPAGGARAEKIRARLEAIYDRLARGDGPTRGDAGPAGAALLERRARAWERALAASWRRTERRSGAAATTGATASAAAGDDAAFVHLWRRGDRVAGLVRVGGDVGAGIDLGPVARWESWSSSLRLRAHRWAFLRDADPSALDASQVEEVLSEMADSALAALGVGRWPRDVRVTSDPSLPDLPWELLPCRGQRLGELYDVLRVPAGRSRAPARRAGRGSVVLGVGAPDLPGVEREVEEVARTIGAERVLSGAAATRSALAEALATACIVHVAGHGWDAEEAPPMAGVRMADGWFSAADLPAAGVSADLVVLAACRTGRAAGPAALAWGGLVTGLLSRGARQVVWTLDDVDDRATASVMTAFHATRRGRDDRSALGRALARAAAEAGNPAAVSAFRISGACS